MSSLNNMQEILLVPLYVYDFGLLWCREKHYDLSQFAQKIHYILNKLKIQLLICKKQIGGY